ncbi:MAG: hypothetical protein WBV69_00235 [Candidatus Sulfotelmatobacter sp.]
MHDIAVAVEIDDVDGEAHSKSMNSAAWPNPEASSITKVICGRA